jgi:uncharacterized protein DUF6085
VTNQRVEFEGAMDMVRRFEGLPEEEQRDLIYRMSLDLLDARAQINRSRVQGYCPVGCGKTLTLSAKGFVECINPSCTNPSAAAKLLQDRETEHLVRLYAEADFTAKHPLRERIEGELFDCSIGAAMLTRMARDLEPGMYRVARSPIGPGGWSYEPINEEARDG